MIFIVDNTAYYNCISRNKLMQMFVDQNIEELIKVPEFVKPFKEWLLTLESTQRMGDLEI